MCGIAAILSPGEGPADDAILDVIAALRHRGPDGESAERIGPMTMVHTRLAIIDVTGGAQPLHSEDGRLTAVVNGEIYNQLELRRQLESRGHRFATNSDSEVVVHGFEEWGAECVERLNGMFAFVIWDDETKTMTAARDPFGVKPLYWTRHGERVGVASEVGALIAAGLVEPEVDEVALEHYLAWRFTPAPRTIFKDVQKLPAAGILTAGPGGLAVDSYRRPPGDPFSLRSVRALPEELAERFGAAVERQMMSDVPYGAFLSGGLDSAAIVAAMAGSSEAAPLTFTVGFPGEDDEHDERAAAAATAAAVGSDHRATTMVEHDFADEVAATIRRVEEPIGSASAPASLQVSQFAAQHVKVVLSGQGADEPFGGYERHQAAAALPLAALAPGVMARPVAALADAVPRNERIKRGARLLGGEGGVDRLLRIFQISDADVRGRLTNGPSEEAEAERGELAEGILGDLDGRRDTLEQALYLDTRLFLPDCLLIFGDKTSMAAGLEQRVPFLDVELMEFVERIPARLRVMGLNRKWIYRQAMAKLVSEETLARRKHPFATPYDNWLRSSLGRRLEDLYVEGSPLAEHIDPAVVIELCREHREGRFDHKRLLYCLLEFAQWHRVFIDPHQPGNEEPSLH